MKWRILILVAVILMVAGLVSLYSKMAISDSESKFQKIEYDFRRPENNLAIRPVLYNDAYLLRIRYAKNCRSPGITFNDIKLTANIPPYTRVRKGFETVYIHLSREIVKEGKNVLNINYPDVPPATTQVLLTNYRKYIKGSGYFLFSDSKYLTESKAAFGITPFFGFLIFSSGLILYLSGRNILANKYVKFICRWRYLLLPFFALILLVSLVRIDLSYKVVITSECFWESTILLIIFVLFIDPFGEISESHLAFFPGVAKFWYTDRNFDSRTGLVFSLLIIAVNLWCYWPSFFHLFRHDEWAFFFSSRNEPSGLRFLIKHIDWQLRLPYDRLIFRPIHHGLLAANRVIFDTNYIGPHLVTFVKHIVTVFSLWWLMWRHSQRWISVAFALLFSVLLTNIDPVIWPALDAYIITTLLIILSIIIFQDMISKRMAIPKGVILIALILFLNLLTTEIAFLMPFCFFLAYLLILRQGGVIKRLDKWSFVFLLPFLLWGILYSIHIYYAYPNLGMTCQSRFLGLGKPLVNTARMLLMIIAGITCPFIAKISYGDKVYFSISYIGESAFIALLVFCYLNRSKFFKKITKELFFVMSLAVACLVIICFGRASYVHHLLNCNTMAGHYSYCVAALIVFAVYMLFDFDKIGSNIKLSIFMVFILIFLTANHVFETHCSAVTIRKQTLPLEKYFEHVNSFVMAHKNEPDFSFKLIDRPPKVNIFGWYHETCIDGLFNHFINNETPKYLLEYDYASEKLTHSLYNKNERIMTASTTSANVFEKTDYVNSIGMRFRKIPGIKSDVLLGIFEVTQKQWKNVMGFNPSRFQEDTYPVENVSYNMVQQFISRLNKMESDGLYKLPTIEDYLKILDSTVSADNVNSYAWFGANAEGTTHAVGSLRPTYAGFYDLIGNVWEWTEDSIYYNAVVKPFKDSPHICFGGSWRNKNIDLTGLTTNYPTDFRHEHLGFRVVRKTGLAR